jgi:hypothetical protein
VSISANRTQLARPLALVGGVAYAVEGAIVTRAPQGDSHWHTSGYTVEAAFVIALVATLPLLPLLAPAGSRAAALAARITQLGFAGMLTSATASLATGGTTLGPAFLLGLLAALAGLTALAATALRARTNLWWRAPIALLGLVLSMALGNHGGGILFGVAWIGISLALRDETEQHPSVVATA